MMKPNLGNIVHYLENGHVHAGIIVGVSCLSDDEINLVFWKGDFGTQMFRANVPFSKEIASQNEHWFWPPMLQPSLDDIKKLGEQIKERARLAVEAHSRYQTNGKEIEKS